MTVPRKALGAVFGRRLPNTEGSLETAGIDGTVVIGRDGYGVPHVEAATDADAWFGAAFAQAQDRSFQLELFLRLTRGTLAELIGSQGVPMDRLMRRIGLRRAAEAQSLNQPEHLLDVCAAFARGINAGNRLGNPKVAHELKLLASRPSDWDAVDVLGIAKLVGFMLSTPWLSKLARLRICEADGIEAVGSLEPDYGADHPLTSPYGQPAGQAADRLTEELASVQSLLGVPGGSNNWVIGADHTATGFPIVASDPHLAPSVPPPWYLMQLRTPRWAGAGAGFVGAPGIVIGHNGHGAWGVTNGMADIVDLFMEEVGPDGRSVREGDEFKPCEVLQETIGVRGGRALQEEVLITRRGPVIGPALEGEVGALSMSATWLSDRPVRGFFEVLTATGFEEFRQAFAAWPSASLNVVYGDADGAVGWQYAGEVPRRERGFGFVVSDGTDPECGWKDTPVPFEDMPYSLGGDAHFVATANNEPIPDDEGPYLGMDWTMGYRAERIRRLLTSRDGWDVDSVMAMQMDTASVLWEEVRDAFASAKASSPDADHALRLLGSWDGDMAVDSPAAAVFALTVAEMSERITRRKAPNSWRWALGQGENRFLAMSGYGTRRWGHTAELIVDQPEGWFERGWPEEIGEALGAVVSRLRSEKGDDPAGWGWGYVRPLTFKHPLSSVPGLARAFDLGPLPWGGDATTISMAANHPLEPTSSPIVVANMRATMPVGQWERARFVLAGGQSGNPCSPHYDDQYELWRKGEGIPIAWTEQEVRSAAQHTLTLEPGG
ncbi:MAG: Penicillin acylase 2 proenzyme [Acidimicrobiales bacterium]|nr:MAG: penicillin acylase family protein [Actinomycetota bacterium]MBV6508692.1 Penicillin acylase 2 proenzyme [Acidimicrobiales bacterium]RIK08129.1 MAG: hypothetical protein DCC48_01755 [Acidobacteriota bacterium]